MRVFLLLICALSLSACVTNSTREEASLTPDAPELKPTSGDFRKVVKSEDPNSPFAAPVPRAMNELVEQWLDYFQGRGRVHMEKYLSRSTKYAPMMKRILAEQGLPEDLIYVVYIESGFSSVARSRASAVGYWQFIRGTGRNYGLKINGYLDERRDPELSTIAAAKYFKSLYSLFGSWYLSLAAYNAGENRIKRVVMKNHTRDFWYLAQKRQLPSETMHYVPKYLAARLIAKDPAKYGFTSIDYKDPMSFAKIPVKKPMSIGLLAKHIGMNRSELKKLNPAFLTDYVPVIRGREQFVRVPVNLLASAETAVGKSIVKNSRLASSLNMRDYIKYRVRRGDTLSHIARRFRTRISTLRRINRMGRRSMLRAGQVIKVPNRNTPQSRYGSVKVAKSASKKKFRSSGDSVHVVRRGETLIDIARRYRVSIGKIARANSLRNKSLIRIGHRLVIPD